MEPILKCKFKLYHLFLREGFPNLSVSIYETYTCLWSQSVLNPPFSEFLLQLWFTRTQNFTVSQFIFSWVHTKGVQRLGFVIWLKSFWTSQRCKFSCRRVEQPFLAVESPSCCSLAQLCLIPCNPMDCSMPGFPAHLSLSPGVCLNSCPLSQWYHPTISSSVASFCFLSYPASGSFPMSRLFASGGQSVGASASASVLLMNIQGWCPLGLTWLISLQSKGLSRVFSSTTIRKHQFFSAQPSLWSSSHICTWLLAKA